MNGNKPDSRKSYRIVIGLILLGAAVLLIGAGRLGDSMMTRQAEQEAAHAQWQSAVKQLLLEKDHKSLAMRHPEYILQSLHTDLRPETRN